MNKILKRLKRDFKNIKSISRNKRISKISIGSQLNSKFTHQVNPNWADIKSYQAWFRSCECSFLSQNGEDGILLNIFEDIGIENYKFIEFGVGDGSECNSANLIKNFGWSGLLIEGDANKCKALRNHYRPFDVKVLNDFITKDNINDLFEKAKMIGEIDLLSIDIDGNDYWVWDAIQVVSPRVVVVEFNTSFGSEAAVTIPYRPDFNRFEAHHSGIYHGMSLTAAVKLGERKGYHYVGCDSNGVNAFFIHRETPMSKFKSVRPKEFFNSQRFRDEKLSMQEQQKILEKFDLVHV